MGYIRHHAIIVTSSWAIEEAHERAREIFVLGVSGILTSPLNGYKSFFIAPDGSKEGWPESDIGDAERKAFLEWITFFNEMNGQKSITFCEVFYGDDNGESGVLNHN